VAGRTTVTKELHPSKAPCPNSFTPFGITTDDTVNSIRNGGIGSTDIK
jgi:hypothetical protein